MALAEKKSILSIYYHSMVFMVALLGVLAVCEPLFANWATGIKNILNPVKISRDDKGVWYITGDDSAPVYKIFEAMGYAVASDRLWQSEKYRRMARGALAEIFGPELLNSDIMIRTISYSEKEYKEGFDTLDPESAAVINGYVAGFNRRISEVIHDRNLLPFEFKKMGEALGIDFIPAPWTYIDVLAIAINILRISDGEGIQQGQIANMALFQTLMEKFPSDYREMFDDLRWTSDPDAITYIPPSVPKEDGFTKTKDLGAKDRIIQPGKLFPEKLISGRNIDYRNVYREMRQRQEDMEASLKKINALVKMGSYAWVVSGDKTLSGNPILYSGPQMDHIFDFSAPSIVTEGSINAGGLNISGMTIPGVPAMVIGRTPHHVWSMQVGHAHTVDYYLESPFQISLHRVENIKVAGQSEDFSLPVFRTSHGPVVNVFPVISWKNAHWGHEFQIIKAYLDLARAADMDEFDDAVRRVTVSQHYCYADRDGNIGYWMSGYDPVRNPEADARFPQAGDGSAEWPEPVTYKPVSSSRNTSQGFYGGWNSRSSQTYENSFNNPGYHFGPFHRGHIIHDFLSDNNRLTFEDVRDLARYIATTDSVTHEFLDDPYNSYGDGGNPWIYVKTDFTNAVRTFPTPSRMQALSILETWDGHFVEGGKDAWSYGPDRSDAWILMNQWISTVLKKTFEDELGWGETDIGYTENRILLFNVLLHALPGYHTAIVTSYDWFSNTIDPYAPQTAPEIIVSALDETLAALGNQPWGIDRRGEITYTHEMLGKLHVMPTSSRSTYAHCVEMGTSGPVRIESMFPLGESGTILVSPITGKPVFDPNFFSMSPVYDGFEHRVFPSK